MSERPILRAMQQQMTSRQTNPMYPQRTGIGLDVERAKRLALEFTITVSRLFESNPGAILSVPGDDGRVFIGSLVADAMVGQRFLDPNYDAISRKQVIDVVAANVVYWWTQSYGAPPPWNKP